MITSTIEERMEIRSDLFAGKIPKRVPVYPMFSFEAACGLANIDLMKAHYDVTLREKAYDAVCETFYSDTLPVVDLRFPAPYQILGCKNWVLGSNGAVQHPEIETMRADEYDALIENPYGFIMETLLPRVCASLDTDSVTRSVVLAKGYSAFKKANDNNVSVIMKMFGKYNYSPGILGGGQLLEAPFDFIADQLRGFKGITMDIRRIPDKVEAACEALVPVMLKLALPKNRMPGAPNFIPLHLAPYINTKHFDKLFWPTLEKVVVEMDKQGVSCMLFAEEDWTRYLEYLETLPESSFFLCEYGDYAKFKQTVGKRHVMGGFFNPTITLTKSKEACIDEIKRMMDVCALGGRFYFNFDKSVFDIKSIDVAKLQAVLDWIYANTDYR